MLAERHACRPRTGGSAGDSACRTYGSTPSTSEVKSVWPFTFGW
jgi:hypothetical protein